jgi:hypothetical protein
MPVRTFRTIATFLLCLCSGLAEAGPLAGSVVGLAGQVFVDRSGQRYGLRLGDQVFIDDTFSCLAGAKLKLRMNDGSVLSLAENTVLRIDTYVLNSQGQRQSAGVSLGGGLIRADNGAGQPTLGLRGQYRRQHQRGALDRLVRRRVDCKPRAWLAAERRGPGHRLCRGA